MKVSEMVGNPHELGTSQPYFGIEIEVERASIPTAVVRSLWDTVHDGSLREGGVEFLSRRPFTRAEVEVQVPLFYSWMERGEFATNIRTSTHVHVNVLNKTLPQVAAACVLYTLLEPIMFRYCGRVREENIYCVPWYRATQDLEVVQHLDQDRLRVENACKYSALYLEPIVRFGTLEFRQAPVFGTPTELLRWVTMCERVVESGFDTVDEVLECFEELSADEFVEGIFGAEISTYLRGICDLNFNDLMEEYDVVTTAELAIACTYKPTEWFLPDIAVEGIGTTGYHEAIHIRDRAPEFYHDPDEDNYEEYPEEEY